VATPPPNYRLLRYDEDYRYLRDPRLRSDLWDPVKYIPLGDHTRSYLSLGGELRERFEYYSAPDFGLRGGSADGYLLHRILLHGDLHLGENFRTFVQLGNHLSASKDNPAAPYLDRLDLQQAFVDIRLPIAAQQDIDPTLRVGRQELAFGSQRLVAIRDAPNVRRNFDGFRVSDTARGIAIDGFLMRPVQPSAGVFDDETNRDQSFWGLYGTLPLATEQKSSIDVYYLGFSNDRARFGGILGRERRHTVGGRFFGSAAGWDWDWEALGQFGSFTGTTARAWGVSTDSGFNFGTTPWSPRIGLKLDAASGDDNPQDGVLETLNPLFPKLAYFNEAALLAPANVLHAQPSLTVRPTSDLKVAIGWGFLWRAAASDAVYIQPFSAAPGTAGRDGRFIGNQLMFEATWRIDRHVQMQISYVHFEVGDALRAIGGRDVDFLMASIGYRF
jgi:hypothetical protein